MKVLKSNIDKSVNFIEENLVGFIESRYVRKVPDYFICYLSSQTGCNRGCKYCHLTATKQTKFQNCDINDMLEQAENVFGHYQNDTPARYVHYNFMARGEPLSNPVITDSSVSLFTQLGQTALREGLVPKFNISTIMPDTIKKSLSDMFPLITPTIYYSLYSVNQDFRKKWMPSAMPSDEALRLLAEYQAMSKKIIKIHGAFIAGENDSFDEVKACLDAIKRYGIQATWNVVRYNPYSEEQGTEASEDRLFQIMSLISNQMPVKMIPRVGPDTAASCGTFIMNDGRVSTKEFRTIK